MGGNGDFVLPLPYKPRENGKQLLFDTAEDALSKKGFDKNAIFSVNIRSKTLIVVICGKGATCKY